MRAALEKKAREGLRIAARLARVSCSQIYLGTIEHTGQLSGFVINSRPGPQQDYAFWVEEETLPGDPEPVLVWSYGPNNHPWGEVGSLSALRLTLLDVIIQGDGPEESPKAQQSHLDWLRDYARDLKACNEELEADARTHARLIEDLDQRAHQLEAEIATLRAAWTP